MSTAPVSRPAPQAKPRLPWVLAYAIVLLLGLGFVYGGWVKFDEHRHIETVGRPTTAIVTGYKEVHHTGRRGSHLSTTCHPTVRFRVADGREIEAMAAQAMERDEIRTGATLRVLYDPDNPSDVHLADSVAEGWPGVIWGLGGLGVVMVVGAAFGLARLMRS